MALLSITSAPQGRISVFARYSVAKWVESPRNVREAMGSNPAEDQSIHSHSVMTNITAEVSLLSKTYQPLTK